METRQVLNHKDQGPTKPYTLHDLVVSVPISIITVNWLLVTSLSLINSQRRRKAQQHLTATSSSRANIAVGAKPLPRQCWLRFRINWQGQGPVFITFPWQATPRPTTRIKIHTSMSGMCMYIHIYIYIRTYIR